MNGSFLLAVYLHNYTHTRRPPISDPHRSTMCAQLNAVQLLHEVQILYGRRKGRYNFFQVSTRIKLCLPKRTRNSQVFRNRFVFVLHGSKTVSPIFDLLSESYPSPRVISFYIFPPQSPTSAATGNLHV
jgi:hypothetical protein